MTGMKTIGVVHSILAIQENVGEPPTSGMIGGMILSVVLVAWLALAFFFVLGVLPRVTQNLEPKAAGKLIGSLLESYYFTGLCLQLLGVLAALDLLLAAQHGFVDKTQAWLWLGLSGLLLLSSVVGRWSLVPGMQSAVQALEESAATPNRPAGEKHLRQKQTAVKIMNGLQIGIGLVALGLFFMPTSSGEDRAWSGLETSSASQPSQAKVIFRPPPLPAAPTSGPQMQTP